MSNTLFIATGNAGKLAEFKQLLPEYTVLSFADKQIASPDETGLTFIENALIKARYASQQTQLPVLADDSGLVVPSLKGEPGIYSARYAGKDGDHQANMQMLLGNMASIPTADRSAYFVCVLVYLRHPQDPMPLVAIGKLHGQIHTQQQGSNGFGYDPIFYLPEAKGTLAELTAEQKNQISHRSKALQNLVGQLHDQNNR